MNLLHDPWFYSTCVLSLVFAVQMGAFLRFAWPVVKFTIQMKRGSSLRDKLARIR